MSNNSEALIAELQKNKEETEAIQALWRSLFRDFTAPDHLQCHVWLGRHAFETIVYGLKATAVNLNKKVTALEEMEEQPTAEEVEESRWSRPEILKYSSKCMIVHEERKNQ